MNLIEIVKHSYNLRVNDNKVCISLLGDNNERRSLDYLRHGLLIHFIQINIVNNGRFTPFYDPVSGTILLTFFTSVALSSPSSTITESVTTQDSKSLVLKTAPSMKYSVA